MMDAAVLQVCETGMVFVSHLIEANDEFILQNFTSMPDLMFCEL